MALSDGVKVDLERIKNRLGYESYYALVAGGTSPVTADDFRVVARGLIEMADHAETKANSMRGSHGLSAAAADDAAEQYRAEAEAALRRAAELEEVERGI